MPTPTRSTRKRRRAPNPLLPALEQQAREAERQREFGIGAACVNCGEADVNILEYPKARLLEAHHALGRHHDVSVTTPLCPTCHKRLHVQLRVNGMVLEPQPSVLETVVQVLRGLATLFSVLGVSLLAFAERLARTVGRLDAWQPTWRAELGGAV